MVGLSTFTSASDADAETSETVVETAGRLAPRLAARAAEFDESDSFVGENFALLKQAGLVEAGVPRELGGGGAEVDELADMLRADGARLQLDRARLFHAHAPGRHPGLALATSESVPPSSRC